MFLFTKPSMMVTADEALPGREETMPVPASHEVLGTPIAPPFPAGPEQAVFGLGCFWGAERIFWQCPGRVHDGGRLRGRLHPEPDLRRGVLGPHRPHRGGARRLRPEADELRGDPARLLGGPRPDPGHAPGQRRRHPVPLGDLHVRRGAARRRRGAREQRSRRELAAGLRRDHDRDRRRPARSTTPSRTTSSTSRRTRTATAGSAARASPARSESRPAKGEPQPGCCATWLQVLSKRFAISKGCNLDSRYEGPGSVPTGRCYPIGRCTMAGMWVRVAETFWCEVEPLLPVPERRFRYRVGSGIRSGRVWRGS